MGNTDLPSSNPFSQPTDEVLDQMERECFEAIAKLREEFALRAQPYADQIARIRNCRPPVIFMPTDGVQLIPQPWEKKP